MHRVNLSLRNRYRFFAEHAGGIVGENAKTAIALARAERLLDEAEDLRIAVTSWVLDEEPYDFGDEDPAYVARQFESNAWTGPFGCTLEIGDEPAASLWGIVVGPQETDDPYCRVVRAQLACEVEDELRQAIGDKLDTLDGALY